MMKGAFGAMRRIALDATGQRWGVIRELCGVDEESVDGRSTDDAVRLLDRLLVDEPGTHASPGHAATLTLPERDLLLAQVWRTAWTPRIAGTLTCASCEQPFDFGFNLDDLADHVRSATTQLPSQRGIYTTPESIRFRLPTADDERALLGLDDDAAGRTLLTRCVVDGDPEADASTVLKAMEQVGSGLDTDFDAACAECGAVLVMRFQLQDYLLGAIVAEWHARADDVHRIAGAYRWGLGEIMALPRRRRRAFISILDDATPLTWPAS